MMEEVSYTKLLGWALDKYNGLNEKIENDLTTRVDKLDNPILKIGGVIVTQIVVVSIDTIPVYLIGKGLKAVVDDMFK